jgi:O-antigen ligase
MLLGNYIFNLNRLLIIILPFAFVTGPFFSDLFCVFIGFTFFLYCLKTRNFSEYKNYIIYFFLVIFFYINFNSFFSFNQKISFETSLTYIRIILFISALSFFFKKYKDLKYYLFYSFCFCFVILFLDSSFQFFSGYNILGFPLNGSRVSSFFGEKLILGSFVTRLLPFIFALIILLKIKGKELVILLILCITGILVVLSNERLSFIYYCLFIIFYFFINFNKKLILKFITFALLFSILVYVFKPSTFDRFFMHTYSQYKQTNNIFALSYRHQTHFQTAYKMFLDNKLLGHGLKSFRYLCDDSRFSVKEDILLHSAYYSEAEGVFSFISQPAVNYIRLYIVITNDDVIVSKVEIFAHSKNLTFYSDPGEYVHKGQKLLSAPEYINGCNTHPHNIYLQFLSELGLLGFIPFFMIFIYVFYKLVYFSIRNINKNLTEIDKSKSFVLFGVFLSMIPILPSGNYFNNWLLIITYLPIGFYLFLTKFTK